VWRGFSMVMTRSLVVMMLGVTELVLVTRAVVAGPVVRMGGGGGADTSAPMARMVTAGAVLVTTSQAQRRASAARGHARTGATICPGRTGMERLCAVYSHPRDPCGCAPCGGGRRRR
jgi:hypothetical protein